jgi:threonine synthase
MWKAFHELKNLKLVEGEMPRMVSVQETGCQPIVTAVKTGAPSVRPLTEGVTASPTGMRVPLPAAGDLILAIIRETGGTAVAVDKTEIEAAQKTLGSNGISASPEGAATWAGLVHLCDEGFIRASDQVVLFNTSHALKYLPAPLKQPVPVIRTYEDFASLG